jgi:hypothetical protein
MSSIDGWGDDPSRTALFSRLRLTARSMPVRSSRCAGIRISTGA